MPNASPGHEWWLASDGRWYPPTAAPGEAAPPTTVPAVGPTAATPAHPIDSIGAARAATVSRSVDGWVKALVDLSGRNRLLYFRPSRRGTLDLGAASTLLPEPVAVDALLAGDKVQLRNLVRDPDKLKDAAVRCRTIAGKAKELLEERGLATLYIAVGLARWDEQKSAATPASPVLLQPIELRPKGTAGQDWELQLTGEVEVNPTLLHKLESDLGCRVDADEVLGSALDAVTLMDHDVILDRMTKAGSKARSFAVDESVVVGTFSYHKLPMVKDLQANVEALITSDLVAAIAGDPSARAAIRERSADADPSRPDHDPPKDEYLVLDADSSQSRAINSVVSGGDLVIQGPPGTGKSQTISNLIATLAARGQRVLFVAEKRAAVEAVVKRLDQRGLGDLVMDLHGRTVARRTVATQLRETLSAVRQTPPVRADELHEGLERRRASLNDYVAALHLEREPWGFSLYEVQEHLHAIDPSAHHPVRMTADQLKRFNRPAASAAREAITRLAGLGGLAPSSEQPWMHAELRNVDDAQVAAEVVDRLGGGEVANTLQVVGDMAMSAGFAAPNTIAEIRVLTEMIDGAAWILSRFQPAVFDQDLAPTVAALRSHSGLGRLMSGEFRRARRLVLSYAIDEDGVKEDVVTWAERVVAERSRWLSSTGGRTPPHVPAVYPDAHARISSLEGLLSVLEAAFPFLYLDAATVPLDQIQAWATRHSASAEVVGRGVDARAARGELATAGLTPLLNALTAADLDPRLAGPAFDFALLMSIRDDVLLRDRRLAVPSEAHHQMVDEFVATDREHLETNPARIRRNVAERAVAVQNEFVEETELVRHEAGKKTRHIPLRQLFQRAPNVMTAVRPCWVMSPLQVSQLLPGDRAYFDVVVFDEASQVPPADAIPALLRGKRAVIAGDSRQLPPTAFFDVAEDELAESEDDEVAEQTVGGTSGFESVLDVLGSFVSDRMLTWHYRSQDEALIAFSNAYIYNHSLTSFPGSGGETGVEHRRVPAPPAGLKTADSVGAEVETVAELVFDHARSSPEISLGVIALGIQQANRISDALRSRRLSDPTHERFFEGLDSDEPFFVKNLERVQGDERDVILLATGYGSRLADGRLRHNFGPLNQLGGERRLNVAITRAKKKLIVVSSFGAEDIDPARSASEGAGLLRSYLGYVASGGTDLGSAATAIPELNPFEIGVRDALEAAGLQVVPQFGASGYRIDFAVCHPHHPGRFALAIECDGASYHSHPTARDRDRLRQEHLERLGWRFHRIWSTNWFSDREGEMARLLAGYQAALTREPIAPASPRPAAAPATGPPSASATSPSPPTRDPKLRPRISPGAPIDTYRAATLVQIVRWVESDGLLRTTDELRNEVVLALGFKRRGAKIVAAVDQAIASSRRS